MTKTAQAEPRPPIKIEEPQWLVTAKDPAGGPDWTVKAFTLADAKAQRITLEAYGFGPVTVTRKV